MSAREATRWSSPRVASCHKHFAQASLRFAVTSDWHDGLRPHTGVPSTDLSAIGSGQEMSCVKFRVADMTGKQYVSTTR